MTARVVGYMMSTALHSSRNLRGRGPVSLLRHAPSEQTSFRDNTDPRRWDRVDQTGGKAARISPQQGKSEGSDIV